MERDEQKETQHTLPRWLQVSRWEKPTRRPWRQEVLQEVGFVLKAMTTNYGCELTTISHEGHASLEKGEEITCATPEWSWNSDIIGLYTTLESAWGETPKDEMLLSVKSFALSWLLTQARKLGSFLPPDCDHHSIFSKKVAHHII